MFRRLLARLPAAAALGGAASVSRSRRPAPFRQEEEEAEGHQRWRSRAFLISSRREAATRPVVACEEVAFGGPSLGGSLAAGRPPPAAGDGAAFKDAYEVEGELGRGSFGVVERVRHKATGQLRAVKRLPTADAEVAEVDALASLSHPNVVGFYEYFTSEDEMVVVQELCEGTTLLAKLSPQLGAALPSRQVAGLLRQMLEAVQHCHERGFVHRDLKVDNFVFASSSGPEQRPELKLIDFGLAGRCAEGQRLSGRAGTVDYSSPEALKEDAFGLPADVWALGAIFFLLITGEPLIKVDQPKQTPSEELRHLLQKQAAEKVIDPRYVRSRLMAVAPRLSDEAVDLLEALLEPEPQQRLTAAQALQHPFIRDQA